MGTTNIALAQASRQMLYYRIHHTQPQAGGRDEKNIGEGLVGQRCATPISCLLRQGEIPWCYSTCPGHHTGFYRNVLLAALAQMVARLPLVQQVRGSIPGVVINFHLKIINLGARRGGDVHFLIPRLYITSLD